MDMVKKSAIAQIIIACFGMIAFGLIAIVDVSIPKWLTTLFIEILWLLIIAANIAIILISKK